VAYNKTFGWAAQNLRMNRMRPASWTQPWASAEIFPGGQRRHFADPFQVADNAMNVKKALFYTTKTLSTVCIAKNIPHESTRSIHILFEIVFRWRCKRICQKGVLQGEAPTRKFSAPPGKMFWTYFKSTGHSVKNLGPLRKFFALLVSQSSYGPGVLFVFLYSFCCIWCIINSHCRCELQSTIVVNCSEWVWIGLELSAATFTVLSLVCAGWSLLLNL